MSDTVELHPRDQVAEETLLSIVYASTALVPFTPVDLAVLLSVSRLRNQERGLTGVLLHRAGQFMQALEGPEPAVRAALRLITADPRHTGVWVLDERPVAHRRFGYWAMGYESLSAGDGPDWLGSPEALERRGGSRADELLTWFRER